MLAPWKKSDDRPRQLIKKQRHYFTNKGPSNQSFGFSSRLVWMWEFYHKESWVPKNCCFWTVVLKKTLESPLDNKEIQPVHPKENQSKYSLEGLMLKLKLQYFSRLMWRADSLEKTLILGKIEDNEENRMKEDEKVGWHHWLNGHEFVQTPEDSEGQGSLVCCSPWGHSVRHNLTTEPPPVDKLEP